MRTLRRLLEPSRLSLWLLCELPLLLILIATAAADPAEGYEPGSASFFLYVPAAALTVLIPMLLNWLKGFLVLYFGGVRCGLRESASLLCRIHALMALLEAAATLLLFLIRNTAAYPILAQLQLFGHELIYAFLFWLWLREKSEASYRRCLIVSMLCFLASSAWLLLSVIASI